MNTDSTAPTRPRRWSGVDERGRRRADVDAEHVGGAADGERREREHDPVREAEDDDARAEHARRRTSSVAPVRDCTGRRTSTKPVEHRADRRRAAQDAEADRPGVQHRLGEHRQQRDRAAEQHGEQVEQDRAQQDRRVADEADAAEQRLQAAAAAATAARLRRGGTRSDAGAGERQRRTARARRRRRARARRRTAGRRSRGRRSSVIWFATERTVIACGSSARSTSIAGSARVTGE